MSIFVKRGPLPRVPYIKDKKKRCKPILEAFKKLDKVFPKFPYYVCIKRSLIKGAGKGVFATCSIPKGTRLGYYRGKCYLPNEEPDTAYLLEISFNGRPYVTIDGAPLRQSNWTRYINSPEKTKHENVIFRQYGKIMYIIASKSISSGDELYLWYGTDYIEQMLREHFTGFKPKRSKWESNKKKLCKRLNR